MKSNKILKTLFILLLLLVGITTISQPTFANAAGRSITAKTQPYVNPYTPAKKVCGYVKDANGQPIANATVYVARFDSFINSSETHKLIRDFYDVVKTDANGCYSVWAYESGYYYAFLASNRISDYEFEDFYYNGGQWPSRFVLEDGRFYACDAYDDDYALIIRR